MSRSMADTGSNAEQAADCIIFDSLVLSRMSVCSPRFADTSET